MQDNKCNYQKACSELRVSPAKILLVTIALACVTSVLLAQPNQAASAPAKEPLAVVGGQPIYEADLQPLVEPKLVQLRQQEYSVRAEALESIIEKRLLEAAAAQKGTTVEKLMEEIATKVSRPNDQELEALYAAQKDRINRPYETVKEQLREAVYQAYVDEARQAYVDELRKKASVAVYLRPPRLEVDYDSTRVRGNGSAPVTIVEFSDFQCPFCERTYLTLKNLLEKYEGRVKLAYRDFPLRQIHPQAQLAAEASRCAQEQGKFWQYHDRLFENQGELEQPALVEHAMGVGLDRAEFVSCLSSGKFRPQIEQDFQDGTRLGISGTPAFFINGVFLSGAQPSAAFEQAIDAELDSMKGQAIPRETKP